MNEIQLIPLERIEPDPENRRVGGFDPVKLAELAASIKEAGVLQPITVRSLAGAETYRLVIGERRWRASKIAGLTEIPSLVREMTDLQVLKIQTIENLQREDVHPLDEADGYARLLEKAGYDVEQIAQELGKSPGYVYQRLKLRELIKPARKLFVEGVITAGHAILIARLGPPNQTQVLKFITENRRDDGVPSPKSLDAYIHQSILMELYRATWKLDDGELLPKAGSCFACAKRTGYQPQLFADMQNGKRDFCMDRECFSAKGAAMVERRREELKGEPHLLVTTAYVDHREQKAVPNGTILYYDWQECKKGDEGAKACLVVAGPGKGRLTYGRQTSRHGSGGIKKSAAQKAQEARGREEALRKRGGRLALFNAVIGKLTPWVEKKHDLPLEILRALTVRFYERVYDPYRDELAKLHGWERPPKEKFKNVWDRPSYSDVAKEKLQTLEASELIVFLVECLLIPDVNGTSCYGGDGEQLKGVAGILGIDAGAVEKKFLEEWETVHPKKVAKGKPANGKKRKPTAVAAKSPKSSEELQEI